MTAPKVHCGRAALILKAVNRHRHSSLAEADAKLGVEEDTPSQPHKMPEATPDHAVQFGAGLLLAGLCLHSTGRGISL